MHMVWDGRSMILGIEELLNIPVIPVRPMLGTLKQD
jgi:hypothetical protein